MSDCEDQGYSLFSDGCIKCQYWEPRATKPTRPALVKEERRGRLWWICPKCHGSYGDAGPVDFQGVELTRDEPRIITLCGSSRFCGEMAILAWEFEKGGAIALGLHLLPQAYCEQKGMLPDADGNIHHIGEQEGVEQQMDALHFKKIEMADTVFIVNIGGYIGSSTAREIAYAKHLGKPVVYFEPPMTAADILNEAAGRG